MAVLLVTPLLAMSSATGEGDPVSGWRFTYSPGDEDSPTLFIGPDRTPLATWEDGDGVLHLSRLNLTADSKLGVALSNLPRAVPVPVDGEVDVVAMDATGVLHVVWEDGEGGVFHKTYDGQGNVLVSNHRLSATDATASAPAVAATTSRDGAAAWVVWVETRDRVGTHLRLVSIDGDGNVLTSGLVDDLLADLGPTACDVAVDLDGRPHVTFVARDGDHWAVPDGDGGFDIHPVHGVDGGTLPIMLPVQGGRPWAVWLTDPDLEGDGNVWARTLDGDGLAPAVRVTDGDGNPGFAESIRASDLATVENGGYLAIGPCWGGTIRLKADAAGGLEAQRPLALSAGSAGLVTSASTATDDRGQTYEARADLGQDTDRSCRLWVVERRPDSVLRRPASVDPAEPVLMRAGSTLDVTVVVESVVGYYHWVQLGIADTLTVPFGAEIVGDDLLEMEGGSSATATVRLIASMTATPTSGAIVTVTAHPPGHVDAVASMDIPVRVPEYRPFIIRGPDGPISALPGEAVSVTLRLESWSDAEETVNLEFDLPRGWTAEAPEGTTLPTGETIDMEVEVTAPEATPAGTGAVLGVRGTTSSGEEGAGVQMPATVASHSDARLDLAAGPLVVMPGSGSSLEATVRNTGNEIVGLDILAHPNMDGWTAQVSPSSLTLTPGSVASLLVWVDAPADALYQTQSRVMVVATSSTGASLDLAYFFATVGLHVDYEALLIPMSTPLMDGRADLTLRLSNNGNSPEELSLSFLGLPGGWQARTTGVGGPVPLSPGETRLIPVTVTAPADTPPETVPVAVQVRGSRGTITAWCDVHVPQVMSVDVSMDSTVRTLTPPGDVLFPFDLHNVGNVAGAVNLDLEGLPFGWDYAFRTPSGEPSVRFDLEKGGEASANLAIKVPKEADGETHAMDLVLWSSESGQLLRQTLYVRLRFPDLAILDFTVFPARPKEGEPVTVRARVLNLGMADAEDVTVVLKDGTRVMDRDTLSIVPRLGELEVVLYLVPSGGRRSLLLQVDPLDEIRERDEANNLVIRHVDVAAASDGGAVPSSVVTASVAAVITVSILGLVGGTEFGRYAFLTLIFIPLYTKVRRDRVLDHYLRGKIHGYIIANPGEHYNAIKDQLDVTNGALSYHLRVLEREGFVRSRMDGIYKRFYPADMKLPRTQHNISSFQEVILTIVKNNHGLSQKDIAKRIGASSQVINYHIKIMEDGGLIRVDRTRRKSRVYATDAPSAAVVE